MERLYKRTTHTVESIARMCGVSRSTIFLYARAKKWRKFVRVPAVRTRYRNAAQMKIGRKLIKWEQVHHIDGDIENNAHDNIQVFPNAKEHTACHGSLERCAFRLFKKGVISWSQKNKSYYLPGYTSP
jgi:hypothetical protein